MINFNKFNINILSVLISSIIFIIIVFILNYPINSENIVTGKSNNLLSYEDNEVNQNSINNDIKEPNISDIENWTLQIDSIKLQANIKQMNKDIPEDDAIGHFKDSNILGNNVALIAYNYGQKNNYFANLKEIELGERIIYTVNNKKRVYEVISNKIIEKNSLKNIIKVNNKYEQYLKLFTYIKDLDNKLRYVCAKEVIDR